MILKAIRVWRSAKAAEQKKPPMDLNSQELAFLPAALEVLETPVPGGIRLIPTLLMFTFVLVVIFSIVTKIDVVATAQGTLLPSTKVKPIQPRVSGLLLNLLVEEGSVVISGELLAKLDTVEIVEAISEKRRSLESALLERQMFADFNSYLDSGAPRKLTDITPAVDRRLTATYRDQYLDTLWKYNHGKAEKQREIELLGLDIKVLEASLGSLVANGPLETLKYDNAKSLYSMNALSLEKWLSSDKSFRAYSESITSHESKLRVKKLVLKHKKQDYADFPMTARIENSAKIVVLDADLVKLNVAIHEAERTLEYSDIRAPENGTVQNISLVVAGQSVAAGSSVMDLIPNMDYLVAEIEINNQDIGFVEIGQEVIVKFDALPYTKYGYLSGVIIKLARDAAESTDGTKRYKALVKLPQQVIKTIEREVELIPGMTVSAEIKLSQRRVIEYFLSTFKRYKSESIREK